MKDTITKLILVAAAIAVIVAIAFPAINSDGAKVKDSVVEEYTQMFQ